MVDGAFCRFCDAVGEETPRHLVMYYDDTVSVKRARNLISRHQISLEDSPGPDPLQLLDFVKRLELEDRDSVSSV